MFGTPSSTDSDDVNHGQTEDDNHQRGDEESKVDDDDDDDDEMDDDTGTLFTPLLNNEALNFFMNSEVSTVNSMFMVDYFNDECFGNDSELHGQCLLIAMYVYYVRLTQHKNFNRTTKNKFWLHRSVYKLLIEIKQRLDGEFARNDDGRGHWTEVELICKCSLEFFPTNFGGGRNYTKEKILKLMCENSKVRFIEFFSSLHFMLQTKMHLLKRYFHVVMMAYFQVSTHAYWC